MVTFQFIVKSFLREVQIHQASLDSLSRLIKNESKRVASYKDKNIPFISYSHLVISDITEENESGWEINYPSGFSSLIEVEYYDQELHRIISSEAGYMIAQCYERLETFLKNSIALHLYYIGGDKMNLHKSLKNLTSFEELKIGIRNIRSKNNSELFKILRLTCPIYCQFETSNNVGHNLSDWYYVFSVVRHAIIHQSGIIKKDQISSFTKLKLDLLQHFFPGSFDKEIYQIEIQPNIARKTIKRISEFGFTVFKGLSIHNQKPWKILKK